MPSPIPSASTPSATSVKPATPTPNVSSAVADSTPAHVIPKLNPKTFLGFLIVIKSKTGTLHAVMNLKAGPGALAVFEDMEQAVNATAGIPACKTNEYFIIPVGGE